MLESGILNPQINSLLSRVRHTNLLVIADRGFPYFPGAEYVDISLVDDIPTVLDVYLAIRQNFVIGTLWMANEFQEGDTNQDRVRNMQQHLAPNPVVYEPHVDLKRRVPGAIGIIRTADTLPYANLIIESA